MCPCLHQICKPFFDSSLFSYFNWIVQQVQSGLYLKMNCKLDHFLLSLQLLCWSWLPLYYIRLISKLFQSFPSFLLFIQVLHVCLQSFVIMSLLLRFIQSLFFLQLIFNSLLAYESLHKLFLIYFFLYFHL